MAKSNGKSETVIIKKYANRRLYDTSTSSYVTLDHLSELVRREIDFEVVDAKTGEDLTRQVLCFIAARATKVRAAATCAVGKALTPAASLVVDVERLAARARSISHVEHPRRPVETDFSVARKRVTIHGHVAQVRWWSRRQW